MQETPSGGMKIFRDAVVPIGNIVFVRGNLHHSSRSLPEEHSQDH